jgi:hypothetical protein
VTHHDIASAAELLVISDISDPDATTLTLQNFNIAGELVIPFFLDGDEFKRQIQGSGFEEQGVWIKTDFLTGLLSGSEVFVLNPGDDNSQRFFGSDLQRLWGAKV